MKRLFRTFLFVMLTLLCGCGGGRTLSAFKSDPKDIFQKDLTDIYNQQYSIRRSQWLTSLQNEDKNANTLSTINELELMLENPDYDNSIRNQSLMQHFERASLYMQILMFPEKRESFLQEQIKNELVFELSSIFLHLTFAEKAINKLSKHPETKSTILNYWKNLAENQKIEYDTLHINKFNAAEKIPSLHYPLHTAPAFKNIEEYRRYKLTPARQAALDVYQQLKKNFGEKMPLILLKLMYKTPYEMNDLYANNIRLKKDFVDLVTELVNLYRSEQAYSAAQNAFSIAQDFQKSVEQNKNPSPEMTDGCLKTALACELAYLKMLSQINLSAFLPSEPAQDDIVQLSAARAETLKLILNDILKKI